MQVKRGGILTIVFFLLITTAAKPQGYFQQEVHYRIRATLNTSEKTISAFESIVYKNNSTTALRFIWFHTWANAYSSKKTALMKQIRKDEARTSWELGYGKGFIDSLNFKVNGQPVRMVKHPEHEDIIKIELSQPLAPGDSVTIETPFKVKLPPYFSRMGYYGSEFLVTQWYPKPAVFDKNGWNEMPNLDRGEYYSEYGTYDVSITLPSDYVVAATGVLQTAPELEAYRKAGAKNRADNEAAPVPYHTPFTSAYKTLVYHAEQVPDFAWFADTRFFLQYDTLALASGRVIDVFSYSYEFYNGGWKHSIDYIKNAVNSYGDWVGEYDYPVVQAVEGPANISSGGMEYPMLSLITMLGADDVELECIILHEVGHNWFMSMLGSNERRYAWMDEGLNSYYEYRYEAEKYRGNYYLGDDVPQGYSNRPVAQFLTEMYRKISRSESMNYAMDTPSDAFPDGREYAIASYLKPAIWMYMLETSVGRERLDKAMRHYFSKWKFKHPQPEDLKAALEESLGGKLDKFFALTKKKGKL